MRPHLLNGRDWRVLLIGGLISCLALTAFSGQSLSSPPPVAQASPTAPPSIPAAEATWSPPLRLSPDGMFAWFPDIAADRTGRIHVVWSSSMDRYDTVMYTASSQDPVQWSPVNDIQGLTQDAGSEATRPVLLMDPNGYLDLMFRKTSVFFSQAPGETASLAPSWRTPVQLSAAQVAYFAAVSYDSKGWLHAVFTENQPDSNCPICFHLFYTRSQDSGVTWSAPVDVSLQMRGVVKPQILVGPQDTLYLAWESGIGGGYGQLSETFPTHILYVSSTDHGDHWSTPEQVDDANAQGKNVSISVDRSGKLLFVWLDPDQDIMDYRLLDPRTKSWSAIQSIPGVWGEWSVYHSRLDCTSMATDSLGTLHLALIGRTGEEQKTLSVLHLAWNGSSWSNPEIVAPYGGDMPEWPRIAVSLGNQVHLVWFVRDKAHIWGGTDASPSMYTVWYAHGQTGTPKVAPVSYPPHPVINQRTPSPTPEISPTPFPEAIPATLPPGQSPPATPPNSEYTLLILFGKGLIPGFVLLVAIVIVRKTRRG